MLAGYYALYLIFQFKHLPLYLEKAPMDIFKKDKKSKKDSKTDNLVGLNLHKLY